MEVESCREMAEEEEEEVVQRLRRVQDAYEHDPSSSSSGRHLCCDLLSLAAHIWPHSIIPPSLLVKLWMSVKDETLKHVHLYNRKTKQCNPTAEPDNASIDQLIQTINVFLGQCLDLPFDLFWEECAWAFIQISSHEETEVAICNMYSARELLQGLLHLMAVNCNCGSPFLNPKFEEASLAKLYILLRLTLEQKEEDGEPPMTNMLFPKWNTNKTIRFGFQIILKLFQMEATCKLDITQPAWHLLKDFLLANEVLRNIPMKTLTECLTAADWNAICKRGFSEEKKDIRGLVEVLLLDYITREFVPETPSARLQILNLVGEGDWPRPPYMIAAKLVPMWIFFLHTLWPQWRKFMRPLNKCTPDHLARLMYANVSNQNKGSTLDILLLIMSMKNRSTVWSTYRVFCTGTSNQTTFSWV